MLVTESEAYGEMVTECAVDVAMGGTARRERNVKMTMSNNDVILPAVY